MNVVITGATGFLGRSVLKALCREPGLNIRAVARRSGVIPDFYSDRIQWLTGDLASLAFCREVVVDTDVIIHFAQSNFPLSSQSDLAVDIMSSVLPSINLLQGIVEVGSRPHLMFASSGGAIYGASDSDGHFIEDDPCLPQSAYGIQKLMIEHHIRLLSSRDQLTSSILRITNAYGVLLPIHRKQGLIGVAMARLLAHKPITIFGSPANVRDYVHLDDVFDAIRRCLSRRESHEVFNIGSGKGMSVAEVLAILERVTGLAPIIESGHEANCSGLVSRCVVNPEKAERVLNWRATIDLEEGIRMMYEEWRQTQ
jgi:UDP-glucose 4-epimerase